MSGGVSATTIALAATSIAATAIGTGVAVYGQIQAGNAASKQANYQAAVARNNAILAQRAADDARQRGTIEAQQSAIRTKQLMGRQAATLAGNGVDVGTGSALDITSETAALGVQDELTLRSNAERQALGFEAQGSNFNSSADLYSLQGANAQSAALTGAFSSGISGIGSVASKWYDFSNAGVPGAK